jgi:hypothetical protein
MKAPNPLLLLVLAVAAQASAADGPRCTDQLKGIQDILAKGGMPVGNANLVAEKMDGGVQAERLVFDIAKAPEICDRPVWRYLATAQPGTKPSVLTWNDDGLKQDWNGDKGLAEQARILAAVNALYGRTDELGKSVLAAGDAVVQAAVKIGVVKKKAGEGTGRLLKDGLSGKPYEDLKGFTVAVPEKAAPAAKPDDLKAALNQILADAPAAKAAPAATPAKTGKGAATAKPEPAPAPADAAAAVKLGPATLAFRKSVIGLADFLAASAARHDLGDKAGVDAKLVTADFLYKSQAPKWAASPVGADGKSNVSDETAADDAVYGAALAFLVGPANDPKIEFADDEAPRDAAALSRLDLGLRNMIALSAAGVAASVAAAKDSLHGQSVAAAVAAAQRDAKIGAEPEAPKMGSVAADVLAKLTGEKKYTDLSAAYDKYKAAGKENSDEAVAVYAQMKDLRADASKTQVVKDPSGVGRLDYGVGGGMATADGIVVGKLDKDAAYRAWAVQAIADNIASNPFSAKVQAAMDAVLGQGGPGTQVSQPPTPDEKKTGEQLKTQPEQAPAPPPTTWAALVAATPAAGFFGGIGDFFTGKGDAARYHSKVSEDVAATASARDDRRTEIEADAQSAADVVQAKADAERRRIEKDPGDPDDSPAVADAKRKAALKKHDEETQAAVTKTREGIIADAKKDPKNPYVDADKTKGDRDAANVALNKTVDAAFSDGIVQSVGSLQSDYKAPGSKRRLYAEKKSGYEGADPAGQPYYKTDRVDRFFHENWEGGQQKAAILSCKADLGFELSADGKTLSLKSDPSPDNLDGMCGPHATKYCTAKVCGVRDGVSNFMKSYKGTNTQAPAPAPVAAQ